VPPLAVYDTVALGAYSDPRNLRDAIDNGTLRIQADTATIWMRLPQVSSKTAVVTGPLWTGS